MDMEKDKKFFEDEMEAMEPGMGPEEVLRAYRERLARAGGLARAAKLSPERRTEIAKKAGLARGKKKS